MKQLWKRAAALTLAAAMCLSLASCGKKDAGDGQEETGKNGGQEQACRHGDSITDDRVHKDSSRLLFR